MAQVEVSHKNDWFYIERDSVNGVARYTDLYIKGNLQSLPGNTLQISNLGNVHVTGNIENNGSAKTFGLAPDTSANVYLYGGIEQQLLGDSTIRFSNLFIQNSFDTVRLFNNIDITNFLQLDNGNVLMNNRTIDLFHSGELIGEDNNKRVYGPYGQIRLSKALTSGNTYTNLSGTGLDLKVLGNLGSSVEVFRRNASQITVSNGSIERYFYFNPTFQGAVSTPKMHYLDQKEMYGNNENDLNFYLSESAGLRWEDKGGTRNTGSDIVDGGANMQWILNNQSVITLAEDSCDTPPYISFLRDTIALCNGQSAWLAPDGIIGLKSVWSNGVVDQDSIFVSSPSIYTVTVTDISGCPNTDTVVVVNSPSPVIVFTETAVCEGTATAFTNQTTISNTNTISYNWEFGDIYTPQNDTSTLQNPTFTYTQQGTYNVQLTAESSMGCIKTLNRSIVVLPYPVVAFTITDNCQDSTLAFTNTSSVSPTAGITYNWNFNNGQTSTQVLPTHNYNTPGFYNVSLTATSNGCVTIDNATIEIYPNPVASFTANNACVNNLVSFTNGSSIASGSYTSNWELETSINSSLNNPTHVFATGGNKNVTLTVTSDNGCTNTTSNIIVVYDLPVPSFTNVSTCTDELVSFTNTSSSLTDAFSWDFGNSITSTQINPNQLFTLEGNHAVKLIATDLNGCSDSITQNVVTYPVPTASFTNSGNCLNDTINFYNTSGISSGSFQSQWNFGNSSTASTFQGVQKYSSAGGYNVTLIIVTPNGCDDTIMNAITVDPNPIVNLGNQITTCTNTYLLDAQNAGSNYVWSNNSSAQTLLAQFSGTYYVTAQNTFNCSHSDTVSIVLNSSVQPQLGPDATFCDTKELNSGYPLSSYLWSDGSSSQNLSINTSGLYWVEVTDINNCVGRDTILATVVTSILPNLGADIALCTGDVALLNPNAAGTYLWSDNSVSTTLNTSAAGTYWVELTDVNGCINYDTIDVVVNTRPVVNLGVDGNYCDNLSFDLTTPNVSYLWSDNSTQFSNTLTTSGIHWAELTDLTTNCSFRDSIAITVAVSPVVNLGNDTLICFAESILLDAQNTGATYFWNTNSTDQTIIANSTAYYSVDVTQNGCTTNDSIFVNVNVAIDSELGADFILCKGLSQTLSTPTNSGTFQWFHNGNLLVGNNPSLVIDTSGVYIVTITDVNGCQSSNEIIVTPTEVELAAGFLAKTEVFVGDTIQFVNISYPDPYTSSWNFDDGAFSIEEDPLHPYFIAGTYNVSLVVSNVACSDTVMKEIEVSPTKIGQQEVKDLSYNGIKHTLLYPNPTKDEFTLEVLLNKEGTINISIYNILGEIMLTDSEEATELKKHYNFSKVRPGMYIVRILVGKQQETIKFIKL